MKKATKIVAGLLHEVSHQEGGEHCQAGHAEQGSRVAPVIKALTDKGAVIGLEAGFVVVNLHVGPACTDYAFVFMLKL